MSLDHGEELGNLKIQRESEHKMNNGNGEENLKVSARHSVDVYITELTIIHLHEVIVFEGGKQINAEAAEQEALDHARRRGLDLSKLKVLRVGDQLTSGGGYRVDVATRKLIALELPASRRS